MYYEYAHLGSLRTYLRDHEDVSDDQRIDFAKDIARGMYHLLIET